MPTDLIHNADVTPTRIPTGRRSKRPARSGDEGPLDYAFRETPPPASARQITREGVAKLGLDDRRMAGRQWFILRTVPREEMRATLILERQGAAVLYPRHAVFRRKNRYSKTKLGVLRPLLVRYLFVGFDGEPNWFRTLECTSIVGFVGLDGAPRQVAYERIAAFMRGQRCLDAPDHHRHMITHKEFEVGDTVEVLDGPFAGHHVKVERLDGKNARAVLTLFGQERPLPMPVDNLVPVRA
jgi:transcription antitermination factor NusG